ncbi:flavin reductase [bacterium]|nr:flavin reductase [bacterium]
MAENEKISQALETMRSGIYIVTSAYRNQPAGCTCVWVSRVSFEPPLIAAVLAPGRHTLQTIERGKRLCVNVLGESSLELARKFGFTSGKESKKFTGVKHHRGASGSPVLNEAVSYLDCALQDILDLGDHRLVLGKVVDAAIQRSGQPYVYAPESFYGDETVHHGVIGAE